MFDANTWLVFHCRFAPSSISIKFPFGRFKRWTMKEKQRGQCWEPSTAAIKRTRYYGTGLTNFRNTGPATAARASLVKPKQPLETISHGDEKKTSTRFSVLPRQLAFLFRCNFRRQSSRINCLRCSCEVSADKTRGNSLAANVAKEKCSTTATNSKGFLRKSMALGLERDFSKHFFLQNPTLITFCGSELDEIRGSEKHFVWWPNQLTK